ncbi:MAG: hypothetical protein ACK5LT_13995 [Lachnospirales bacterium]
MYNLKEVEPKQTVNLILLFVVEIAVLVAICKILWYSGVFIGEHGTTAEVISGNAYIIWVVLLNQFILILMALLRLWKSVIKNKK